MPYRALAETALERWRVAHRLLEAATEGNPEWEQAYIDAELAKQAYQDVVEAARRRGAPEPPPFNDVVGEV